MAGWTSVDERYVTVEHQSTASQVKIIFRPDDEMVENDVEIIISYCQYNDLIKAIERERAITNNK